VGFYRRTADPAARRLTLYAGSTVPATAYMVAYRNNYLANPHGDYDKCNMLPSGCYVCRVASHHNDEIKPALRMSSNDNLAKDAECTVVRTFNDLMYGTDDFWDKCTPTDNVHCSYVTDLNSKWGAFFSSEGCVTVRGKPARAGQPASDQWAKFQGVLDKIGQQRRCDLVLITGRDLAIAAAHRVANPAAGPPTVPKELARLRCGSHGEEVRRLVARLGMSDSDATYFGPATRKALIDAQASRRVPLDGIFSPALDTLWGWNVFASGEPPVA